MITCTFTISDYQIKEINEYFNQVLNRNGTEEEIKLLFESFANCMNDYVKPYQFREAISQDFGK